jgi:hypothetical protein
MRSRLRHLDEKGSRFVKVLTKMVLPKKLTLTKPEKASIISSSEKVPVPACQKFDDLIFGSNPCGVSAPLTKNT